MSSSLTVDGRNSNYTNAQIAEFVRTHKPEEVAKAAAEAGVGLKQISEATGHSLETLSGAARQVGYEVKSGGGTVGNSVDLTLKNSTPRTKSPSAIPITSTQVPIVRAAVHGEGNKDITDEEIQDWFAAAPRTPEDIMVAMVQYGVSAQQAGRAMGYSDSKVEEALVTYGLDKQALDDKEVENQVAIRPEQAETVFEAVHGAGNSSFSDEDIRAWATTHSAATPDQIIEAMVAYGVSATQVGKALGINAQRVQELVSEYGVDSARLALTMVEGWTEQDFKNALAAHPDKVDSIKDSSELLGIAIGRTNTLMDETRSADDLAAADQAAYEALNSQFAPAFAAYNNMAQEVATLQGVLSSEQGQKDQANQVLANINSISEKHYQRRDTQKEAELQIQNSDQRIADANARIAYLNEQMKGMESWGIPLMEKTQAAKAKWDQSAQIANQKNEISTAQGDLAQQAAATNKADTAATIFSGQALSAWAKQNSDLGAAEQVNEALKNTVPVLEEVMTEQRGWVDVARQRGQDLEGLALDLEATATVDKGELDKFQPARLQAEASIGDAQQTYDSVRARETKAEADLNDAYKKMVAANYFAGSGDRKRARDEAARLIDQYTAELTAARQQRAEIEGALNQAKSGGFSAIADATTVEAKWKASSTLATNARNHSLSELNIGSEIFGTESSTTEALASVYALMVDSNQTQVATAQELASKGAIGIDELNAVEDSVQGNIKYALTGLAGLQETAAIDKTVAYNENQASVALQQQAYGIQLITEDKLSDANYVQNIYDTSVNWDTLKANLSAATERLKNAKLGREMADMRMDWAEGRTNQKKQPKAMAAAQGPLQAAEQELAIAQQEYDMALAALNQGSHLNAPLRNLAIDANWSATSSVIDSQTADNQAYTQSGWANIAQGRFNGVDNIIASVQGLIIQDTAGLSVVQAEMSKQVESADPDAAKLLDAQAKWNAQWANDYRDQVITTRQAEQKTYSDQQQLDTLKIQAAGMYTLGAYLEDKAKQLEPLYEQAKAVLPGLTATFEASTQTAEQDTNAAEAARNSMTDAELQSMVDFVMSRSKDKTISVDSFNAQAVDVLTQDAINAYAEQAKSVLAEEAKNNGVEAPEFTAEQIQEKAKQLFVQGNNGAEQPTLTQEQIHRTAMQLFVDKAQTDEMANRPTLRKQLHYVDDRQIWIDGNSNVQAARANALPLAQTAEKSTQAAINDGEELQARTFIAMLQGQRLLGANSSWADATAAAAVLAKNVNATYEVLEDDINNEKVSNQNMVNGMVNYLNGNMQLAQAMNDAAQTTKEPVVAQLLTNQVGNLQEVTQAHVPVLENTDKLVQWADQLISEVADQADQFKTITANWQDNADKAAAQLTKVQETVEADAKVFDEDYSKNAQNLSKMYSFHDWSVAAVREHAQKAIDAKELHQDRVTADRVYKIQKKKAFIKQLIGMAIMAVAVIATMGAGLAIVGPTAGAVTSGIAAGVGAAAGSAIGQAISIGAGIQEKFSILDVAISGLSAGFTVGLLRSEMLSAVFSKFTSAGRLGTQVATSTEGMVASSEGTAGLGMRLPAMDVVGTRITNAPVTSLLDDALDFGIDFTKGFVVDAAVQKGINLTGLRKGPVNFLDSISMGLSIAGLSGVTKFLHGTGMNPEKIHGSWQGRIGEIGVDAASGLVYLTQKGGMMNFAGNLGGSVIGNTITGNQQYDFNALKEQIGTPDESRINI